MEAKQITEVIEKLVGSIDPAGATHIDSERRKNLLVYLEVLDNMHTKVCDIAYDNRDRHELSIKEMVTDCNRQLNLMSHQE